MKTYIVTGACGYVGFAIVKELKKRGKHVRCLVMKDEPHSHLDALGVEIYYGDITRPETLRALFDVPGELSVIHSAGMVSVDTRRSETLAKINVEGTINILHACENRCVRLIYIGSVDSIPPKEGELVSAPESFEPDSVFGAYAKTKAQAAKLVLESAGKGLDAIILLPCAVFGPYDYKQGLAASLVKVYLKKNVPPMIKGGYEFVDVRDVALAAVEAEDRGVRGRVYILSNSYIELKDIVDELRKSKGLKKARVMLPNILAKAVGGILQALSRVTGKRPMFTAYTIDCINTHVKYDCQLARRELGYSPRPFKETLADTVAFMETLGYLKCPK